jgi:hypothetical protein
MRIPRNERASVYGDLDQKLGGAAPLIGSQLVYCVGRLFAPAKKLRVSRRLSIKAFHHAVSIRQIAQNPKKPKQQ